MRIWLLIPHPLTLIIWTITRLILDCQIKPEGCHPLQTSVKDSQWQILITICDIKIVEFHFIPLLKEDLVQRFTPSKIGALYKLVLVQLPQIYNLKHPCAMNCTVGARSLGGLVLNSHLLKYMATKLLQELSSEGMLPVNLLLMGLGLIWFCREPNLHQDKSR